MPPVSQTRVHGERRLHLFGHPQRVADHGGVPGCDRSIGDRRAKVLDPMAEDRLSAVVDDQRPKSMRGGVVMTPGVSCAGLRDEGAVRVAYLDLHPGVLRVQRSARERMAGAQVSHHHVDLHRLTGPDRGTIRREPATRPVLGAHGGDIDASGAPEARLDRSELLLVARGAGEGGVSFRDAMQSDVSRRIGRHIALRGGPTRHVPIRAVSCLLGFIHPGRRAPGVRGA